MRNLKCKVYENEMLISETTKQQKEILSLLNIIVPTKCGNLGGYNQKVCKNIGGVSYNV
jgi:hypothetical protein